MSLAGKAASLVAPRLQIDDEVALERIGDPQQRVDPWRSSAPLQPRDRRLSRADELGKLALGQSSGLQTFERALVHSRHCRNAIATPAERGAAGGRRGQ